MSLTETSARRAPVARLALPPWARFLLGRLGQALLVMALVVIGNFVIMQMAPGDLVTVIAGGADMTQEQMADLRARFGLDLPLLVQFWNYVAQLLTFDLGYSYRMNAPVWEVLSARLPTTAALVVLSLLFSVTIGTVMGVVSARRAGTLTDMGINAVALVLYAAPSFVVAMLLVLVFSVKLGWFPIAGLTTVSAGYTGWALVKDMAAHLVMPVTALCTFYVAIYARLARSTMLEVMDQDYVRTARAKGLSETRVIYVHTLRNALLPIVTMAGLQVSTVLGGAVVVETVFGLPGMARTAYDAVFQRDTTMLLGVMFVSSLAIVIVNLAVDLLYTVLDPRVSLK
ncbi:ABC transporter permease [Salipiger abyssi]|uniref:Peptide/nickel transport system permease protein n=1 Tax=Salipiger abyssi TaxID=1250539 RepID=A0A1P8UMK2_9RHOB|nr:ABC transporter permease [Salipiger abyssi]APZ50588.1 peptide/nickel transport system permease protein [Salipiger abyssi]